VLRDFAIAVVTQQPGDYLRVVSREIGAHLLPGVDPGPAYACLSGRYGMPPTAYEPGRGVRCHPELAGPDFTAPPADARRNPLATPVTMGLAAYSGVLRTPTFVVTFVGLLTLAAAFVRRRRGQAGIRADVRDAGLLVVCALSLIVPPVLVGMYDPRYALPALPLVCVAAGLILQYWLALIRAQSHREQYPTDHEVQSVVRTVERDHIQWVVTRDEQAQHAQHQVDRANGGVGQTGGPGAGDGRGDHRGADGEVNDVVQRVDLEYPEKFAARVPGNGVSTRDSEAEQPDHDEDGSDDARDERVEPAAGTHAGDI
jgi:hypothetical protein